MIKFIHAADLHLDTPFHGLQDISEELAEIMHEAPFRSFQKIVDKSIEKEVDFVLLSGDLYNTQKINIKAQSIFIKELKRLKEMKIPVFLIRGNHDFLTKDNKKLSLELPDNVYQYSENVETHLIETRENKRVAITAFSYESQWIYKRKIQDYPRRFDQVDLHIGMLHGELEYSNGSKSPYAPFTIEELRKKKYDYWALGHIHQRQEVSSYPLALYPGNIQGLHKNEKGEKGCLLVEWSDRGAKIDFISTATIVWEEIEINLAKINDINQLIQKIEDELINNHFIENYLIHLVVHVNTDDDEKLIELLQKKSFAEDLTNQLNFLNLWIADIDLKINKIEKTRTLKELYPMEWLKTIENIEERKEFSQITEDILMNIPNKYLLEKNTGKYRKKMIEKAITKIYLK